jgi:hypothetical protein
VVEFLQNTDLSREAREVGTVLGIVVIVFAAVVIIVVVIAAVVRREELLRDLIAHHSPVVRDIAFITVVNVPRPSSCFMS